MKDKVNNVLLAIVVVCITMLFVLRKCEKRGSKTQIVYVDSTRGKLYRMVDSIHMRLAFNYSERAEIYTDSIKLLKTRLNSLKPRYLVTVKEILKHDTTNECSELVELANEYIYFQDSLIGLYGKQVELLDSGNRSLQMQVNEAKKYILHLEKNNVCLQYRHLLGRLFIKRKS